MRSACSWSRLLLLSTVKAIAMLARERTPLLPELRTADEQGLKDFDVSAWNAILLPKSATRAMVERLNEAMCRALEDFLTGSASKASYLE